jgi:hypothetical protein
VSLFLPFTVRLSRDGCPSGPQKWVTPRCPFALHGPGSADGCSPSVCKRVTQQGVPFFALSRSRLLREVVPSVRKNGSPQQGVPFFSSLIPAQPGAGESRRSAKWVTSARCPFCPSVPLPGGCRRHQNGSPQQGVPCPVTVLARTGSAIRSAKKGHLNRCPFFALSQSRLGRDSESRPFHLS